MKRISSHQWQKFMPKILRIFFRAASKVLLSQYETTTDAFIIKIRNIMNSFQVQCTSDIRL